MSRTLNKLTVRQVDTIKKPGRHADGGGLYLRVSSSGSRSWIFMVARDGKRDEIGLGSAPTVKLALAREKAEKVRSALATGADPRAALKHIAVPVQSPTFREVAEQYIASVEKGWNSAVHRQQWRSSLRDHAAAIGNKPVDAIGTDDILSVLEPIWLAKPETAKRVRGRIERILDVAKVKGLRSRDATNPAAWRGHLALLLPAQSKLSRSHHPALPYKEAPAFMAKLRARPALAARCLEFVILTAARSGEALGVTWSEIDFDERLWTVPARRMKAGVVHEVPLSNAALGLLEALHSPNAKQADLIFAVGGAARSNMAMAMLLRRMGYAHVTTHGFRSTFRDWAGDMTTFPREVIEQALAHTITNAAERAYRRGTAIERRRQLMQDFSMYLSAKPTLAPAP